MDVLKVVFEVSNSFLVKFKIAEVVSAFRPYFDDKVISLSGVIEGDCWELLAYLLGGYGNFAFDEILLQSIKLGSYGCYTVAKRFISTAQAMEISVTDFETLVKYIVIGGNLRIFETEVGFDVNLRNIFDIETLNHFFELAWDRGDDIEMAKFLHRKVGYNLYEVCNFVRVGGVTFFSVAQCRFYAETLPEPIGEEEIQLFDKILDAMLYTADLEAIQKLIKRMPLIVKKFDLNTVLNVGIGYLDGAGLECAKYIYENCDRSKPPLTKNIRYFLNGKVNENEYQFLCQIIDFNSFVDNELLEKEWTSEAVKCQNIPILEKYMNLRPEIFTGRGIVNMLFFRDDLQPLFVERYVRFLVSAVRTFDLKLVNYVANLKEVDKTKLSEPAIRAILLDVLDLVPLDIFKILVRKLGLNDIHQRIKKLLINENFREINAEVFTWFLENIDLSEPEKFLLQVKARSIIEMAANRFSYSDRCGLFLSYDQFRILIERIHPEANFTPILASLVVLYGPEVVLFLKSKYPEMVIPTGQERLHLEPNWGFFIADIE